MKSSARSQKIQLVTASDYLEFMKCPMKVHGSVLSERLFHDIPSCSPPTSIFKGPGHAPPGPPPGPLATRITSWSSPVKINKQDHAKNPWGIFDEPLNEICSPPTKISKAGKNSVGAGNATTKVVTGFNIEQSFRRLSCEENKDSSEDKGKVNVESLDSVKQNQKENIVAEKGNQKEKISSDKDNNEKISINYVFSNKPENSENSENENPWITVHDKHAKHGPHTQTRAKINKENKATPPSSFQSKLAKQLCDGAKSAKKLPSPSEDFTTKFALRLLQTQPQTQQHHKQPQQKQQQNRQQKEKRQSPKQIIDRKENCDALRGSPTKHPWGSPTKHQWHIGGHRDTSTMSQFSPGCTGSPCPRFQPEWRMTMEQGKDIKHIKELQQQILRKRTRSGSKSFIGTRIIYERKFLMQCRASPLAKTPPANLPNIPGITSKDTEVAPPRENGTIPEEPEKTDVNDEDQFDMDL